MTDISLVQFARYLGANTVTGMARKVGLALPPPPILVRNLIELAGRVIFPLAPVDLQPRNGASGVSNNPDLFFRDSAAGTPAATGQFTFVVTHNNILVGSPPLTGGGTTASPLTPPGVKWFVPLPQGEVTLSVFGTNRAGNGPASSSTFTVGSVPPSVKPTINVTSSGSGQSAVFVVSGSGFSPSLDVRIRVVDDALAERDFVQSSDARGNLNARLSIPCISGLELHFSATDGRPDPSDLTGVLFSNAFNIPCP